MIDPNRPDAGARTENHMNANVKQYLSKIGTRGGSASSDAKAEAARANGAKGGRPSKFAQFARLSQKQKRSAFPLWYEIADQISALREQIADAAPSRQKGMSQNAHRRACAAYYTANAHRYDALHAARHSLRPDQIPPKAPPAMSEREWREWERELETMAEENDSCAIAELEELDQ